MPKTDDHHDNRYEDGESLPTTNWDTYDDEVSKDNAISEGIPIDADTIRFMVEKGLIEL